MRSKRFSSLARCPSSFSFELFIWEIFWTAEKHTYYTEEAIINMIDAGHLILYKNT